WQRLVHPNSHLHETSWRRRSNRQIVPLGDQLTSTPPRRWVQALPGRTVALTPNPAARIAQMDELAVLAIDRRSTVPEQCHGGIGPVARLLETEAVKPDRI